MQNKLCELPCTFAIFESLPTFSSIIVRAISGFIIVRSSISGIIIGTPCAGLSKILIINIKGKNVNIFYKNVNITQVQNHESLLVICNEWYLIYKKSNLYWTYVNHIQKYIRHHRLYKDIISTKIYQAAMKFLATLLSLLVISQQSLGCFVWVLTPAPPPPPAPSPLVDPQYRSMLQLRVEDGKYYKNPNWRVGPNKRVGLMIYS